MLNFTTSLLESSEELQCGLNSIKVKFGVDRYGQVQIDTNKLDLMAYPGPDGHQLRVLFVSPAGVRELQVPDLLLTRTIVLIESTSDGDQVEATVDIIRSTSGLWRNSR